MYWALLHMPQRHCSRHRGGYGLHVRVKGNKEAAEMGMNSGFLGSILPGASLVVQTVKNLPAMQETHVQSLGQEDPLEKRMATRCSILGSRIPWTEELAKTVIQLSD